LKQYKDFFEKKNFILTTAAKKRLILLKNFIELKINVLLEGPTGTAKTLSAEIICDLLEYIKKKEKKEKYKKKEVIKFNLSSETTIPDLLGRYIGSNKSLA
jgi:MoxR-like ATPase